MKNLLLAVRQELYPTIFRPQDAERLAHACRVLPADLPPAVDKHFLRHHIGAAQIVITSWDTAPLDAEIVAAAPALELVVHAAGSVKPVVSAVLWERGIRVASMAAAIAHGVAEFCLGFILLAPKRVFWTGEGLRGGQWHEATRVHGGPFEIYGQKIGIIGAGHVGRCLIRLLQNFTCDILIFDPFVTMEQAAQLGATKVATLDELFAQCRVVSLNAPNTAATRRMIRGRHFALLPPGAVFINTARGAIIDEEELIAELRHGRFVACLDVSEVEPPPADHPFRHLPNVILTPHIAGVLAQNRLRIGTLAADEIEAYVQGRPLQCEVTRDELQRIG